MSAPSSSSSASAGSGLTGWVAGAALGFGAGLLSSYIVNRQCSHAHTAPNNELNGSGDYLAAPSPLVELPLPLRDTKHNPKLETETLNRKQNIEHVNFGGKRVLMRVDYNVKVKNGKVVDATRITSTIQTLRAILEGKTGQQSAGAPGAAPGASGKQPKCIVLITHLGRPAGNIRVKEYTVEPLVGVLKENLPGVNVRFLKDCIGEEAEAATKNCEPGTVFLCENLRFHPEETGLRVVTHADGRIEKIRSTFAEKVAFRRALSRMGDVFVFEAFGAAHRPHSSIIGIDLPQRVAGLLMHKEMSYYGSVLSKPQRPFVAIIGGAKVSDKILVLENLLDLVDEMIIGGGMTYTFLRIIHNVNIGDSLFDQPGAGVVHKIVEKARLKGVKLHLPQDHIIGDKFAADAKVGVTDNERGIPSKWMGLDIGPKTRSNNSAVIARASTVLWNGPLGVYELGPFGGGTISAFWDLVSATKRGATTIIGGGDTGSASKFFYVGNKAVADSVSHVSTGGGSSLVLMEGKLLPAVGALSDIGDYSRPPPPDESKEPVDDEDE